MKETPPPQPSSSDSEKRPTEVLTIEDLSAALSHILASKSEGAIGELRDAIVGIKREFDPSSVTMTSTNIPDASRKLASVLDETSAATTRVFRLLERQQQLLSRGEQLLAGLEQKALSGDLNQSFVLAFIHECRSLHGEIHSTSHHVFLAHEFQDLTAQKIKKVSKVVHDLDEKLRGLLKQLGIETPQDRTADGTTENQDIDQSTTDAILKDLGV